MELCPACQGSGDGGAMITCRRDGHGCLTRHSECRLCEGTGQVDSLVLWRAELGHLLRESRVYAPANGYQTQRQAAERRGLDVAVYNRIEAGRWPAGLTFHQVIGWIGETAEVPT